MACGKEKRGMLFYIYIEIALFLASELVCPYSSSRLVTRSFSRTEAVVDAKPPVRDEAAVDAEAAGVHEP